jgi:hypothetical protein
MTKRFITFGTFRPPKHLIDTNSRSPSNPHAHALNHAPADSSAYAHLNFVFASSDVTLGASTNQRFPRLRGPSRIPFRIQIYALMRLQRRSKTPVMRLLGNAREILGSR